MHGEGGEPGWLLTADVFGLKGGAGGPGGNGGSGHTAGARGEPGASGRFLVNDGPGGRPGNATPGTGLWRGYDRQSGFPGADGHSGGGGGGGGTDDCAFCDYAGGQGGGGRGGGPGGAVSPGGGGGGGAGGPRAAIVGPDRRSCARPWRCSRPRRPCGWARLWEWIGDEAATVFSP